MIDDRDTTLTATGLLPETLKLLRNRDLHASSGHEREHAE
jgi:hypothetical protein